MTASAVQRHHLASFRAFEARGYGEAGSFEDEAVTFAITSWDIYR